MTTDGVPLALAFGAGLLATVNPCGFALLPSFVSYYLGSGSPRGSGPGRVSDGLVVGLVLTAGFLVVFASVGIVVSLGARAVVRVVPWATIAIGVALVASGLWLLSGRSLGLRLPGVRAAPRGGGYGSIFAFGMAYAVGSLSCTLPVFLVVVGSGLAVGSALGTLAVFAAYGLGMATILMLLCLGTAGFREILVRRARRVLPHARRIGGALLVLSGAYVAYYWVSVLSGDLEAGPVRAVRSLQGAAEAAIARPGLEVWFGLGATLTAAAAVVLVRRRRGRGAGGGIGGEAARSEGSVVRSGGGS
jgi:cytochrome c-type biogenesis protein